MEVMGGDETVWVDRSGNDNNATVDNCEWTGMSLKTISNSSNFCVERIMINTADEPYTIEVYFSRYALTGTNAAENVILANSRKEWKLSSSIYIKGYHLFYDMGNNGLDGYAKLNKPYHLTIVKYRAGLRKAFVNGKFTHQSGAATNGIHFLGNLDSSMKIKGNYYSIRLYNRALTEEEIQHNYLYEQSIERGE